MNLTISGHHLEVTPALRGYVTTKLERISRHFDQVVDIKVLLTVDNLKEKDLRQRAERDEGRRRARRCRQDDGILRGGDHVGGAFDRLHRRRGGHGAECARARRRAGIDVDVAQHFARQGHIDWAFRLAHRNVDGARDKRVDRLAGA